MRRILLFLLLSWVVLSALYIYHSVTLSDNKFHLIFCDVGQGDGIFIRTPTKKDIIIDGGPGENSMTDCLSRHLPFWDRDIDIVYLTHPDADHLTGLIEVVKTYRVKYFGTSKAPKDTEVYKELVKVLKDKSIPFDFVYRGDKIKTQDGVVITALWPTVEFLKNRSEDANDYSLVHLISFGKFDSLLTGDIPAVYLNSIMPLIKKVDVFKPPHHGSKTGVDESTFQHLVPKLAVISAGKKNKYGHPNKEVLNILKLKDIPYRTTFEGDVEIKSDGDKWWLKN